MGHVADLITIAGVPFLVLLNAFFVAAEFALVTIRWTRVEEMVEERKLGAVRVREGKGGVGVWSVVMVSVSLFSGQAQGGVARHLRR